MNVHKLQTKSRFTHYSQHILLKHKWRIRKLYFALTLQGPAETTIAAGTFGHNLSAARELFKPLDVRKVL